MPSAREMRLRIRSVKNISQVTRALETVSASKVKKAVAGVTATRPYAEKAWKVLVHLARQPGHASLHPLLVDRPVIQNALVIMISGDRGLAGPYNMNILRFTLQNFLHSEYPVKYITVGRKGRDLLSRRRQNIIAEFSNLPPAPAFADVSAIGRIAVDEYLAGNVDAVYLCYTEFKNMIVQTPRLQKLLPMQVDGEPASKDPFNAGNANSKAVFSYEPDATSILDEIIQRFTALQIYKAVLSSLASEHAARMVSMRNATDNANELASMLQMDYNKARQQAITNDMLDIAGGAEALAKSGA